MSKSELESQLDDAWQALVDVDEKRIEARNDEQLGAAFESARESLRAALLRERELDQ